MDWMNARTFATMMTMAGALAACDGDRTEDGGGAPAEDGGGKGDGADRPDGSDDTPARGLRTGVWSGRAEVAGGRFTRAGSFDARLVVYVGGDRVRGYLDIEQTEAGTGRVDSPSYFVDGEIDGNVVSIELTERVCGAGEPVGLCYPDGGARRLIYRASGTVDGDTLSFEPAEVIPGSAPLPDGLEFEPPFAELALDYAEPEAGSSEGGIVGRWRGACRIPRDVVYSLDLPMFGDNEMEIALDDAGAPTITRFVNRGTVVWPQPEPILLGDTFRYDDASGRFWFVSLWNIFGRWLYAGRHDGDVLEILLIGDDIDPATAIWSETGTPVDPLTADLLHSEGACTFRRQRGGV